MCDVLRAVCLLCVLCGVVLCAVWCVGINGLFHVVNVLTLCSFFLKF